MTLTKYVVAYSKVGKSNVVERPAFTLFTISVPPEVVPTESVYPVGILVAADHSKFVLILTPVAPLAGVIRLTHEGAPSTTCVAEILSK